MRSGFVVAVVVGAWALGWCRGLRGEVLDLQGRLSFAPESAAVAVGQAGMELGWAAAAVTVAVGAAAAVGVRPAVWGWCRPSRAGRWRPPGFRGTDVAAAVVFVVAAAAAGLVVVVVGAPGFPHPAGSWALLPGLVGAVAAGPAEEICLVAVPTVLLRRAGWGWPGIGMLVVGLRVSFHLYYRAGVVGIVVWAVIVWVWYVRSGSVLGPMIAHSVLDVTGILVLSGPVGHLLVLLAATAAVITTTVRSLRRKPPGSVGGAAGPASGGAAGGAVSGPFG